MSISFLNLDLQSRRPVTLTRIVNHLELENAKIRKPLENPQIELYQRILTTELYFKALDLSSERLPTEKFIPNNEPKPLKDIYDQITFAQKLKKQNNAEEQKIFIFDFDNTLFPSNHKNPEKLKQAISDFALLQEYCRQNNIILVLATGQTEQGFNKLLAKHFITLSGVDIISDGTASRMSFRIEENNWQVISDYTNEVDFEAGQIDDIFRDLLNEDTNIRAELIESFPEIETSKNLRISKQDGLHIYNKFTSYITYATKKEVEQIVAKLRARLGEQTDITTGIAAEGDNSLPETARNYRFINIQPKGIDGKTETKKFILNLMNKLTASSKSSNQKIKCVIAGDSNNDEVTMLAQTELSNVIQINIVVGNASENFKAKIKKGSIKEQNSKNSQIRYLKQATNHIFIFPKEGLIAGIVEADEILNRQQANSS